MLYVPANLTVLTLVTVRVYNEKKNYYAHPYAVIIRKLACVFHKTEKERKKLSYLLLLLIHHD